jgi:hemoglobin-like flavoprotein
VALPNPRFEASYERLFGGEVAMGGKGAAFFESFYQRFLTDPEIARLFERADMKRQREMLRRSLFTLVSFYVLDEVSPELKRIAEVHHRLGLKPGMFDWWMQCLLDTVGEFDPQCDEATLLAWGWAMAPGITYIRIVLDA